jgi:chemotaxis protein methyltransferase CheR
MNTVPSLQEREYTSFSKLIFEAAGIHLGAAKQTLVAGRLAKRLLQYGLSSYGDYLALIGRDAAERQTAVDLLTTNETYFFREPKHFEFLGQTIVPGLRGREPRIWCGACSSGEEPYTIAMVLAQTLGHLRFQILASDISTRVLEQAQRGLYPIAGAEGIPAPLLAAHCLKGVGSQEGLFLVDRPLRERVGFAQINLNAPLPEIGTFDVIFLRNVMIYFSQDTKRAVLERLVPLLRPGGWFIVSHSESLHGVTDALQMVRPSIYRKPLDEGR